MKAGNPFRELVQPFVDLARAPRALWAVNLASLVEGFAYFGVLTYLAMYFNGYGGLPDREAGWMVGLLTSGITLCMLLFGGTADRLGPRRTLLLGIAVMALGRVGLAALPHAGFASGALLAPFTGVAALAILFVVLGYGIYYPASYAAVRAYTTPGTASMGFAMLYAVMNLGGWLPSFLSPIRMRYGISGAFAFCTAVSVAGLAALALLLSAATERKATAAAQAAREEVQAAEGDAPPPSRPSGLLAWLKAHPLADPRFAAFLFSLMPVQTLFAYNWLVLPQYIARAYAGSWVGQRFEVFANLSPLLVFLLCPLVAALASKAKVYPMMLLGTAVMAAPAFLLALGPTVPGLLGYLVLMTVGEALWQPRFLQFAAEIAPEGRTGAYMGVAQFPWFLTKVIVPLYSGAALGRWCPAGGPLATGRMWLFFACIACATPLLLLLGRRFVAQGKGHAPA